MVVEVRVVLESGGEPGSVAVATEELRRRLEGLKGHENGWQEVRVEPRTGGPPTQGAIGDIVLGFVLGEVLPATALATAAYVVRAVYGHFRTQPDPTQRAVLSEPGLHIVLTPDMTPEQLAHAEELFRLWIERHRPGEAEGE
ncbi:hypothetical protein [Streptomyces armeniacus]|uniref:hypothetical protein n=1 Tax=Streptomyces armeniacus TaxID=83291 RepID=UPI001AD81752|nr:hypothetical protein [Streptomyces armeniacus]